MHLSETKVSTKGYVQALHQSELMVDTCTDVCMGDLCLECSSVLFGPLFVEIEMQMFTCNGSGSAE